MATTRRLQMVFADTTGESTTLSYGNIKDELDTNAVKALMSGLIANGSIFENPPAISKSAKIIETNTTELEID